MIHQRLGLIQKIHPDGAANQEEGGIRFIVTARIYNSTWKFRWHRFEPEKQMRPSLEQMKAPGRKIKDLISRCMIFPMGVCAVGALYDGEASDLFGLAQNQFLSYQNNNKARQSNY